MTTGKARVERVVSGLAIPPYDYEINTYSGDNPTQTVYKRGGANGTVVATVTRTFDTTKLLTQTLVLS